MLLWDKVASYMMCDTRHIFHIWNKCHIPYMEYMSCVTHCARVVIASTKAGDQRAGKWKHLKVQAKFSENTLPHFYTSTTSLLKPGYKVMSF